MPTPRIRRLAPADMEALGELLSEIELFPPEALQPMYDDSQSDPDRPALWLVAEADGVVIGFAFSRLESFTPGTWNLLALGVTPALQGVGVGGALVKATERALAADDGRLLLIDTSSADSYGATRAFYAARDYDLVATIPDYWDDGEDKVTFRKRL